MRDSQAELLEAEILVGVAERAAARNQLAELGVNPSPADVSAWMAMDSKTQRRMALQYVILVSDGN